MNDIDDRFGDARDRAIQGREKTAASTAESGDRAGGSCARCRALTRFALDLMGRKTDIPDMHFVKLFLATSFAAAAALRGGVTLLTGAEGVLPTGLTTLLSGPSGMALEMVLSVVGGALLAHRVLSIKRQKATLG